MPVFEVEFKVDQVVTKSIRAEVVARNSEEAEKIVLKAADSYPKEVMDRRVSRMVTVDSNYWPPRSKIVEGITKKDKNG